jgi:hypothetical protein
LRLIEEKAAGRREDAETDRGREDEMLGNEKKYNQRDANTCSIECGTGDGFLGCSGLKRWRRHKAEELTRRKSGWSDIYWEELKKMRR